MKKTSLTALIVCVVFVAVLALTLGLTFNSTVANAEDREVNIRIAHISDLHFYPEELSNSKSIYYQAKVNSENKFVGEAGPSIRKTFESMVGTEGNIKDDAPMIVLVSGDLTLNGESEGHYFLAKIFAEITEMVRKDSRYENFQILVVPGNHDMFNPHAMRYYPTEEELDACTTPEDREELLTTYAKQAPTPDNQEFIDLYWSFGYAHTGEVNPRTGEVSKLASNISLEFFYDSEYWYEDDYGLTTVHPPVDVVEECKKTKDYSLVNPYVRHGACSYIARTSDITVVSVDANSRKYIGSEEGATNENGTLKEASYADWQETTSGDVEDMLLRWVTTSIKSDVQNDKLIVGQLHHNIVPHFAMEGDVLSMFTYDDYKKVAPIFADAGLKYVFTGHMHASDVAYTVSQSGNVIYDMETGTPIGLGAAYRIIDLQSTGSGANYTEDVYTQVVNLDTNFDYFTADSEEVKHFVGGHYEYFKKKMLNMVPTMVGSYVNDGLYERLLGMLGGVSDFSAFVGGIATDAINGLSNLDLYPIVVENDKIGVAKDTRKGYDLIAFANDLVDYVTNFDFSYGTVSGGYKISELIFDVYGGHLLGTNPNELPENLFAFFAKLEDGTFVQWMVDVLYNTVVPELDLILNAPIRYDLKTPTLEASGVNGIDISASYNMSLKPLTLDSIIKSILDKYAFGTVDENGDLEPGYIDDNGYISLKNMLKSITVNAPSVVNILENNIITKPIVEMYNVGELFDKYFGLVEPYLSKYYASDMASVIKSELLDKYVTKALCVNLGVYAKNIIDSIAVDPSYDGGYFDENGNLVNERVHLQYTHDGVVQYAEHSFNKTAVEVKPTADNGLLPAQVSISNVVSEGEISPTQMKLRWTTHITLDVFDYTVPESFIAYARSVDGLANATRIKANGENVNWEFPTIDLGIHYLNMTYVYDTFNLYNVKLENLEADTTYYYILGNDATGWTEVRSFKTPKSSDADSYTIMGITDIQGSIENNYKDSLPNLLIGKDKVDADIVISLGDNVDNGKNIYQYYWMLEGQKDFWSYIAFVGVPGNHEDGENELSTHVNLPNEETGKEYYSFFYVNTMYIMLNTNDLESDGTLSIAQYDWLENTLKTASQDAKVKWIVVGMHKGLYTAGSHAYDSDVVAMRAQLHPLFAEYGVDVVLQGHDHTYSVTNPLNKDGKNANAETDSRGAYVKEGGVIYINLGTMGGKFYDYLYSEAIGDGVFVKRSNVGNELAKYLTSNKYLELKETPVFMDLTANDNELTIKTYTVVEGKAVQIDNIVITDTPVYDNGLTVAQIVLICVSVVVFAVLVSMVVVILKKKTTK